MEPLPIALIAWVFTIAGLGALLLGAYLLTLMYKADKLPGRNVDYTVWNDIILLGIWGMSFMAGMGLLNNKSWAPTLLEYFCGILIALTIINSMTRIKIMKDKFERESRGVPFPWPAVLAGAAAAVVPVTLFCAATIWTLHDEGVKEELRAAARK